MLCLARIYEAIDSLLTVSLSYKLIKETIGDVFNNNTWGYIRTYRYVSTYI